MKTKKFFLSFLLSLLVICISYAQEKSTINPEEIVDEQLEALDKDIDLDDFQKFELRDFLLESTQKIKTALDNGMESSEIRFLIEDNNRELDAKLKEILLPEQFEKYMELKRERAVNKKKKKKR
ncbi:MAG: hypothetical protein LBP34_02435 [Flavobacteriaceae bacterium]|jgi:hypothetical protein|nr:hypothetical protein [Flavobacteriaceae bacterium]